jgi:hypothetical protein
VPTIRLSNRWRAHSVIYTLVATRLDTYDTFVRVHIPESVFSDGQPRSWASADWRGSKGGTR